MKLIISFSLLFTVLFGNADLAVQEIDHTSSFSGIQKSRFLNKPIPKFEWETIYGEQISSDSLKGKVVILSFWRAGCLPCMREVSVLNELAAQYKDKAFTIVSAAPHTQEDLLEFNKEEKTDAKFNRARRELRVPVIKYPIVAFCENPAPKTPPDVLTIDCNTLRKQFKVKAYPTVFVIDKKGIVRKVEIGFAINEVYIKQAKTDYQALIDQLLAEE